MKAPPGVWRDYLDEINLEGFYNLELDHLSVKKFLGDDTLFKLKRGARFAFKRVLKDGNYVLKVDCSRIPYVRGSCSVATTEEGTDVSLLAGSLLLASSESLPHGTFTPVSYTHLRAHETLR